MRLQRENNSGFLYKFGNYPDNLVLINKLNDAAARLYKRLSELDVNKLDISEYNSRYFGGHVCDEDSLNLNLIKYGYVLVWALSGVKKNYADIVFLDYGGGHGMLSLLAKEIGIGTVVHSDIYPVSCEDAKKIGQALGLEVEHYVPGDIDAVIDYFKVNELQCDVVANYDVIEHIYDINDFLKKIHLLSSSHMNIFFASAANEKNPRIAKALKNQHLEFELRDRARRKGRKPTDATRAILDLRKEIIREHSPSLNNNEINQLALLTRGLIKPDIIECVDEYISSQKLPQEIVHPTNTCDPFTGNWFEHLMDPYELAAILNSTGFQTVIMTGYYDSPSNIVRKTVKTILNLCIRLMGRYGLYFAPYYALHATK